MKKIKRDCKLWTSQIYDEYLGKHSNWEDENMFIKSAGYQPFAVIEWPPLFQIIIPLKLSKPSNGAIKYHNHYF